MSAFCKACKRTLPLLLVAPPHCFICHACFCDACAAGQLAICKTAADPYKTQNICYACVLGEEITAGGLQASRHEYFTWIDADSVRRLLLIARSGRR